MGCLNPLESNPGAHHVFSRLYSHSDQVSHNKRGVLSMANHGIHTNASQFFVTLEALPWCDTKYVAFGQLIEGETTLAAIESLSTYGEAVSIHVFVFCYLNLSCSARSFVHLCSLMKTSNPVPSCYSFFPTEPTEDLPTASSLTVP